MKLLGLLGAAYVVWWATGKRRLHYAVIGDGEHDCAPGLQARINEVAWRGGGIVQLESGVMRITDAVRIPPAAERMVITGGWFERS
jgi:hypothetical protein